MTSVSKSLLLLGMGWAGTSPAGLDRYISDYAQCLCQLSHQVEFCGVGLPDAIETEYPIKFTNLSAAHLSLFQRLRSIRREFSKRSSNPIDAVNLHFALNSFPILDLLPKTVPVTFTFHGPWFLESQGTGKHRWKNLAQQWIERYVYDRCDRFIVLSQAFSQVLQEQYWVPEDKIHIVPGGVNLNWFSPTPSRSALREAMNWPQDRFILFTARRFDQRMGLQSLITALDRVREQHPDVLLMIAGRGNLAATLSQQVSHLNLSDHVKFLGFVSDSLLRQCYQAANLTVVPSQFLEGFGLVVVESLACGTPVLCTPVGGMKEIIAPLSPDLITASRQTQDIAALLFAVLRGEIDLPKASECRAYAEQNFNWITLAERIQSVLLQPRP